MLEVSLCCFPTKTTLQRLLPQCPIHQMLFSVYPEYPAKRQKMQHVLRTQMTLDNIA